MPLATREGGTHVHSSPRGRLALAGLLAALVFALALGAGVWTRPGQWVDNLVAALLLNTIPPAWGDVLDAAARKYLPAALGLLVVGLVLLALARGRWRALLVVLPLPALVPLTQWLREEAVVRPALGVPGLPENGFPSTHATVGFALLAAALLLWPIALRPWAVALLGVLGGVVALGNVSGHAHRPVDVIGSAALVATWVLFASAATRPRIALRAQRSGK